MPHKKILALSLNFLLLLLKQLINVSTYVQISILKPYQGL